MEGTSERMTQAVQHMVTTLEKNYITPKRKQGFLCAANCCDQARSPEELQRCVQRCEQSAQSAATLVDSSLKDFQARLQRCAVRCQDEAQESLSVSPNESEVQKAQASFEKCTLGCLNEFEKKLPKLQRDIEQSIQKL